MIRSPILLLSAAALAVLAGCGSETSSYPPYQPGTTTTPGGGGPDCSGDLEFKGTLDGQPIHLEPHFGVTVVPTDTPMLPELLVGLIEPGGMLVLPNIPALADDPTPHPLALLRLPDGGPNAETWYGFGAGTEIHIDASGHITFTLASPVRLGRCPGTPVDASLVYCDDGMGSTACSGQATKTTATFDGAPVTWTPDGPSGLVALYWFAYLAWDNGAYVASRETANDAVWGILSMPLHQSDLFEGPDAGSIFCVDAGDIGMPTATFEKLSALTTFAEAPPVDGTLQSCP